MPISLPPISRRWFLSRTALALASLVPGASLFGAQKRVAPHSWALLSDTHIAADSGAEERGVKMSSHLQKAIAQVLSQSRVPGGAIIAGDCAYKTGETSDYQQLGQLLQPVRETGVPIHLLLGNHDQRDRFLSGVRSVASSTSPVVGKHVAFVSAPRVNWLLLDSLETTDSTPGVIGSQQLAWLKEVLDADWAKPAIVVVHHNLGMDTSASFDIAGLKDSDELLELIRPRRQVKAYIYGHTHNWQVRMDSSGLHFINLPPVAYVFREGAPAGWVLASIQRKGMRLEMLCIDPAHPSNGQSYDLKWRT